MRRVINFLAVLVVAIAVTGCGESVPDGHQGYLEPWMKTIQPDKVYGEGWHWMPIDDLVVIDHRERVTEYNNLDIRLASQKINLEKVEVSISWRVQPNKGGYLIKKLGFQRLPGKLRQADIKAVKGVIGGDTLMTIDAIFEQRDLLAANIKATLATSYDEFYCEPIAVSIINVDIPPNIDEANARRQALAIEKDAEADRLAIAKLQTERREEEGRAAAAFQEEVGEITAEVLEMRKLENVTLGWEVIREGLEKGLITSVVLPFPMALDGNLTSPTPHATEARKLIGRQ